MKKLFFLFAILFTAVTSAADDASGAAVASFPETSHDFGVILESNGPVSHDFYFSNDGSAPLVIISAKAQCGCTRPKYPARPVNPGKSGEIKVTFLPAGYKGEFTKEVTIRTNDPKHKKIKLRISGVVVPAESNR